MWQARNTSVEVDVERGKLEDFSITECASSAESICALVSRAILSKDEEALLLQREGQDAQIALNVMQKVLCFTVMHHISKFDHEYIEKMLETNGSRKWRISSLILKLSIRSNKLPASLVVNNVTRLDKESIAGGGFADIFRGEYKGKPVALKRLRVYRPSDNVRAWQVRSAFTMFLYMYSVIDYVA